MVCVQVKSFPSSTTSVTTLQSVRAWRSPGNRDFIQLKWTSSLHGSFVNMQICIPIASRNSSYCSWLSSSYFPVNDMMMNAESRAEEPVYETHRNRGVACRRFGPVCFWVCAQACCFLSTHRNHTKYLITWLEWIMSAALPWRKVISLCNTTMLKLEINKLINKIPNISLLLHCQIFLALCKSGHVCGTLSESVKNSMYCTRNRHHANDSSFLYNVKHLTVSLQ